MGTALVFLLVLALCEFIAYIGDLLGRRLGKKRLTVFGLRPKHTAILLTIVTGVFIASTTLGLALLIVPGFSKVVTQGERMLAINLRLTGENNALQKQNDKLRQDTAEEKKHNDQLSRQNTELDKKNSELQKANETIAAQNSTLTKTNQSLSAGNTQLRGQNQSLSAGNKTLAAANKHLRSQQSQLSSDIFRLKRETTLYQERHYVFRAQEDIVRQPFPPNPPLQVVSAAIRNLDFQVRSRAAKSMSDRGIPTDPQDIKTQLVPPPNSSAPRSRATLESWLANRTLGIKNIPILLRAIANQNCVEGQPIPFYIEPFPNPRVFRQGDVIASCRLDGQNSRGQIVQQLVVFLQRQVHARATAPPNSMLITNEGLGNVSYEHLINTAERVALSTGLVRVDATATTDVARSGPLNIALEVKPGEF